MPKAVNAGVIKCLLLISVIDFVFLQYVKGQDPLAQDTDQAVGPHGDCFIGESIILFLFC